MTNADQDVEQMEPSNIAGKDVKWNSYLVK